MRRNYKLIFWDYFFQRIYGKLFCFNCPSKVQNQSEQNQQNKISPEDHDINMRDLRPQGDSFLSSTATEGFHTSKRSKKEPPFVNGVCTGFQPPVLFGNQRRNKLIFQHQAHKICHPPPARHFAFDFDLTKWDSTISRICLKQFIW